MPGNFYTPSFEDISRWPKPNYTNPPEQRSWLGAFAIAWQVVSTVPVLGRLYLRINKRSGPFGLDDGCIFVAWLASIALTVTACISDWQFRIGRHIWNFEPKYYGASVKVAWLAQVLFLFTMAFTKCSVLLCYRRMAKVTHSNVWMYLVWVLLFITVGSSIGMLVAYCFMCQPLHYYWDFLAMNANGETGHCVDGNSITIATGALTIASDLWTAAFPCAMFHSHNMGATKRQKILLNCLFCAGFLVTGVGVARTYYLWEIGHHQDLSWYGYDLFASSIAEVQLAIICICLPFIRSFFRAYFPDLVTTNGMRTASPEARRTPGWTATGEEEEGDATRLVYELDEKGMVAPKYSPNSPAGEGLSRQEQDEIEWARQQVQQNDYKPQQHRTKASAVSSVEVKEEGQTVGTQRLDSLERKASVDAEKDEEWKRSKVREWVTKRPVKRASDIDS